MPQLAFDILARDRASKVFDQVGAKSAKTEQSLTKVGAASGSMFGKLTTGVAGVVGGFQAWDKVMVAGFNRLANLDDARKRLDQMGLSTAEAKKLMDGLTETVTGTAFSLDAGAGAMTGFVSAGVDLDEVNSRLQMTADTAAFAQAPLDEIGNIFVKIQSQGRLTAEELNMLQERGVPALVLLADAAGVTAEAMRDMISKGQVDAERFFDLWEQGSKGFGENNIKIEGAAKSMGDTIRGSLANAETALARVGAEILERFIPTIDALADGTKSAADQIISAGNALDDFNAKTEETVESVAGQDLDKGFFSETTWNTVTLGLYGVVTSMKDLKDEAIDAGGAVGEFEGGISRFDSSAWGAKDAGDALAVSAGASADALGEVKSQGQLAAEQLGAYADAALRATSPVFALSSALEDVDAAQEDYNAAVDEFGAKSPQAQDAALKLAGAVAKAEQAAIDGDLSFGDFERKLEQWVAQGAITAAQAETIRGRVKSLRGEAEDFAGNYQATLNLRTQGLETWRTAQAFLDSIKSKTVTITAIAQLPPGVTVRQISEGRQHGGPVAKGWPYVVGEAGPELFVPDRPGLIVSNKDSKALAGRQSSTGLSVAGMDSRQFARDFVNEMQRRGMVVPRMEVARRADLIARGG
jgi:tape measure domain-containing protein